jgi:pimeloyl-ACP methyl ester carboxylesterase
MYIQTPDSQFQNLHNFNYTPSYVNDLIGLDSMRMAYIDVGQNINGIALCLHGNPTWGYMYRHMIPTLINSGFRVIVPDLIGFGRSDKPIDENWHTPERHHQILKSFIKYLSLENIMLVCHDWGGILGLTLVPDLPDKFASLVITNTALPSSRLSHDWFNHKWDQWVSHNNQIYNLNLAECFLPRIDGGRIASMQEVLLKEELKSFMAPYPTAEYKSSFRIFPALLSNNKDSYLMQKGETALEFYSKDWQGKCFIAAGIRDTMFYNSTIDLANIIRNSKEPFNINSNHWILEYGELIIKEALKEFNY